MEAGNGDPVFFQRFLHHPARAGPRFTHDQGHMGELREGKPFTGHGGLHASCQNNFVLHKWLVMQVRARCRAFHDAKLHGFILDGLFYFLRIAAFQPYAYFRVMAVEQGQQRRQHILGHGGAGSQAQFAGNRGIAAKGYFFSQRFVFLEDAAGMGQQAHAFRRQGNPSSLPFEQTGIQQTFQFLDMPGDGRLRDEQFLRRARKIQAPCDGFKHFQPEIRNHGEEIIFNHAAGGTASSFPPHDGVRRWEWRSSARRAGARNIPEPYIL